MATQTPERPAASAPASVPPESDPVAQTLAFIQPWIEFVPPRQRRLGLFIALALLIHILAFFSIRIVTTRAELRHQPRTHVAVDAPPSDSAGAVSPDDFLDRIADPRLFLLPAYTAAGSTRNEAPLDFRFINSDSGTVSPPDPAPPEQYQLTSQAVPPLEQRVSDSMQPPRQTFSYDRTPPAIAATTTWQWEDALNRRQPTGVPSLPSPVSDTDLNPTELRIAINPSGGVEHALVEQSCGNGRLDLDQQAILAVRKVRFRPAEQSGLQWGTVTIFWHYAATPREEVVPSTPSGP
ncbi:MAG: energy transducer TonB [Methylacidiphilales bacterium]|nr:energy transducer TonB [Candidatus Methylacidiphilales bacterium]